MRNPNIMTSMNPHRVTPILFWLLSLPSVFSLSVQSPVSESFKFNFSQPGSLSNTDLNFFYLNSSQEGPANTYVDPKIEMIYPSMETVSKSIGRVSYARPVPLWDEAGEVIADFSMGMTICLPIHQGSTSKNTAPRLAIFLGPYDPSLSNGEVMNHSNANATTSKDEIIEVEFDAYLQENGRGRAISVDVNHIVSMVKVSTTLFPSNTMNQSSGCTMMIVQMDYNGRTKRLDTSLRIGDVSHHINASVDLTKAMPKVASIGFLSTTGQPIELQNVLCWSFNSTLGNTNSTEIGSPPPVSSWLFWKEFLVHFHPWNRYVELNLHIQIQRIWKSINLAVSSSLNITLVYGIPNWN